MLAAMPRPASLAALFLPAILALAACGGDDGGETEPFPTTHDPARNIPAEALGKINVVVAGSDFYVGQNNFVFGITNAQDEPEGGATARATFYDLADAKDPKPVLTVNAVASAPGVGPQTQHLHAGGEVHVHGGQDEDRVGYYVPVEFTHAGPWGVAVEAVLRDGTQGVTNIGFQVFEKPNMPAPGAAAFKSDNLTRADVRDIREIDSGDPPNDMHDVKIKDAIAAGRPLVVVFSTPAFCTSRFCGPVNEEVEYLKDRYDEQVDFVHIEIWKNFDRQELNPTAREWLIWPDGSLREPVVYVIDEKGTIYDRWEGPVARNIMEPSVKAVAEGATR